MRNQRDDYQCCRCGYKTSDRSCMRRHLLCAKKPCPATKSPIELTNEIKEWILDNRVYHIPSPEKPTTDIIMKTPETYYQKIVEKYLKGTHKAVQCGVTDITTSTTHAEIKVWKNYKEALGQLIAYNTVDPKERLQVYLFGRTVKEDVQTATLIFSSHNIECYTFVETPGVISIINLYTNENVYDHIIISKST